METDETRLKTRFYLNMKRVNDLLALALSRQTPPQSKGGLESDTLRGDLGCAVVVFLHATFEDVLRTAALQRLDAGKWQDWDGIPLAGGRDKKFELGALNAHRKKTVDQLIHESLENYLDRRSFGSCADVEKVFEQMALDTTPFKPLYADLDRLMTRRHRIVHNADLPTPKDSVSPQWTTGDDFHLVLGWLAVMTFFAQLCVSVNPGDELQRWYLARTAKSLELAQKARAELIALRQNQPAEAFALAAQKASECLREALPLLPAPSEEELLVIAEKIKSSG